jgi:hypothetical protein
MKKVLITYVDHISKLIERGLGLPCSQGVVSCQVGTQPGQKCLSAYTCVLRSTLLEEDSDHQLPFGHAGS